MNNAKLFVAVFAVIYIGDKIGKVADAIRQSKEK